MFSLSLSLTLLRYYHVTPFHKDWVRAGLGLGLMGKLDCAWVGALLDAWWGSALNVVLYYLGWGLGGGGL